MCQGRFRLGQEVARVLGEWSGEVEDLVNRLLSEPGLHAVVLTGSYARGTHYRHSDVDLWIVHDQMPMRFQDRHEKILDLLAGGKAPIEPLVYRVDEVRRMLAQFHLGLLDALAYGKVVYSDGTWEALISEFEGLKARGLRALPQGWDFSALENLSSDRN